MVLMPHVLMGQEVRKLEDETGKYEGEVKDGKPRTARGSESIRRSISQKKDFLRVRIDDQYQKETL